ncbi:MAG: hypothetical protein OXD46_12020 [Chloroflexi bacterium]|nr:hypothetical protein [Chloroflexota bacterium]
MNERETRGDIRNAEIKWKIPGAGFVMQGGFVALVDRNPDPYACTAYGGPPEDMEVHLRTCRETWASVWALEGDTLEEARQSLAERRFCGSAYHVNDCELLDDRPQEDAR